MLYMYISIKTVLFFQITWNTREYKKYKAEYHEKDSQESP